MINATKAYAKERVQAFLSQHGYIAVPFLRAAKGNADEYCLRLLQTLAGDTNSTRAELAKVVLDNAELSYAQYQQDCFALWATGFKSAGTFVEFGAADGVTHSTTYMLEKSYGWSGLLIEPRAWAFKEAARRRPNSTVVRAAVDPSYQLNPAPIELVLAGQLSSIVTYSDRDRHAFRRSQGRKVKVPAVNLTSQILECVPDGLIDFMSIDVEGPELDIIKGFDFSAVQVTALTIEVNDRVDEATEIAKILAARGYYQPFGRDVSREDLWFLRVKS
jgi:FkbM family methyltransferase